MQQHVPPQRRGLPPHEKRRQRANQLSVIVYVMASLIFIAIMLFNMRGDAYIGAEKGDQKILGAAGGRASAPSIATPPRTAPKRVSLHQNVDHRALISTNLRPHPPPHPSDTATTSPPRPSPLSPRIPALGRLGACLGETHVTDLRWQRFRGSSTNGATRLWPRRYDTSSGPQGRNRCGTKHARTAASSRLRVATPVCRLRARAV